MRTRALITGLMLVVLVPGLVLSLSGCGGTPSEPAVAEEPTEPATGVSDYPELIMLDANVADSVPVTKASDELEVPDAIQADTETSVESHEDVLILSWSCVAGALKHDDALSIYASGRVTAIARNASMDETVVRGTLNEGQLTTVTGWVDQHAAFTRREMDSERAVRTTILQGRGDVTPAAEMQVEIAGYAAAVFLGLTESE